MTINLTLAVQAINFFIAYLMIKKLLLDPAVEKINEDDAEIASAQARLKFQEEAIRIEEQHLAERLSAFKKAFLEHEPDVARALELSISVVPGMPKYPTLGSHKITELAKQTAHMLVDEVARVN